MALRDRPEFLYGRTVEQLIAQFLRERGFYVNPTFDYAGQDGEHAPWLESDADRMPVPDLDVAGEGARRWVEVKGKHKAIWRVDRKQYEHGISLRQFRNYQRVQAQTGTEVWLCIYEQLTGDLLLARIDHLALSFVEGEMVKGDQREGPMANWPRMVFTCVARIHKARGGIAEQLELRPTPHWTNPEEASTSAS